jgi:hypothetical protein
MKNRLLNALLSDLTENDSSNLYGNPPVYTRSDAHRPSFTFEDPEEHKENQRPNGGLKSSVWPFRASDDGTCGGMSPT